MAEVGSCEERERVELYLYNGSIENGQSKNGLQV